MRAQRERLAIEGERRRIAWELHDSAKQRVHAAHLLVSSLHGQVPDRLDRTVERAMIELESAAADMDTSLAEPRSPLDGRSLHEALAARAHDLNVADSAAVSVRGRAPELSPLVSAHVFRIACEAMTNALRHADADHVEVDIAQHAGALRHSSPAGSPLPATRRAASNGRRSKMIRMWLILPSRTVRHSAPWASWTGTVSTSYISTACASSPNAAIRLDLVRICANRPIKPRNTSAPSSRPVGARQTMSSTM